MNKQNESQINKYLTIDTIVVFNNLSDLYKIMFLMYSINKYKTFTDCYHKY